jgi:hypothetical protein
MNIDLGDAHHDATCGEPDEHTAVSEAGPSAEHEDGELAVGGGERPVGESTSVGVAEGQHRRHHIGNQNVVPLELREDLRKSADRYSRHCDIASICN